MGVVTITTKQDFDDKLVAAGDKLVVVDFTAGWCGPCRIIAPKFQSIAEENPDVDFLKVDVDANQDLADEYKVQGVPTFIFIRNGKKLESFSGANEAKLKENVLKLK
uniref:Thioredoxin n=1 Tax=Ciona intestinalis TaxID=7719 RepID=H2XXT0_CIOIN|nr:thioredoxin-like [Ciona intestinalis]|eukprot:XP_009861478.1 thioredoxin-like [Ciona intestinalis]